MGTPRKAERRRSTSRRTGVRRRAPTTRRDGYDFEKQKEIAGDVGDFFRLSNSVIMERENFHDKDERNVFGCPNCLKIFMKEF